MKKKYRIGVIAVAAILILSAVLVIALYFRQEKFDESKIKVDVYFVNPAANTLEPETRYITKGENGTIVNQVFDILFQAPKSKKLARFPMEEISILDAQLTNMDDKTVLELEFSSEYNNLTPTQELFFRASLVWSMTELDFITDVNFFVAGQKLTKHDGTAMGFLNRGNVVINPVILLDKIETQEIVLYFPDKDLTFLYTESRSAEVNPNADICKHVVTQLLAGPKKDGLISTIPSETIIRSVTRDGDTCYVSFNSDFINKHTGGLPIQNFTIYSIVNSLTELSNVKKVQFLIESEKVKDFKGGFDLSKPIGRNESMIAK